LHVLLKERTFFARAKEVEMKFEDEDASEIE
jgi:hypothetical protein